MPSMSILPLVMTLVLVTACTHAPKSQVAEPIETPESVSSKDRQVVALAAVEAQKPESAATTGLAPFQMALQGGDWQLNRQGHLELKNATGRSQISTLLPVEDGCEIVRVKSIDSPADIFLFYELACGEEGHSRSMRLDRTSLAVKWVTPNSGFNLGAVVLVNEALYVTSIGRVQKVDLATGNILWQREDLYDRVKADIFNTIVLKGATLRIEAERFTTGDSELIVVHLDEKTGRLMDVR